MNCLGTGRQGAFLSLATVVFNGEGMRCMSPVQSDPSHEMIGNLSLVLAVNQRRCLWTVHMS